MALVAAMLLYPIIGVLNNWWLSAWVSLTFNAHSEVQTAVMVDVTGFHWVL